MYIVVATCNQDKLKEILTFLEDLSSLDVDVLSLSQFPEIKKIDEDGLTLEENAKKKAEITAGVTKLLSIADDTGLEVDYLNGQPGVLSARFAGTGCNYSDNNKKLLSLLEGIPFEKRTARFRCVVAISQPGKDTIITEGKIEGHIATEEFGNYGFGYDPVFIPINHDKTFAELETTLKNEISHRAEAFTKAKAVLLEIISKV